MGVCGGFSRHDSRELEAVLKQPLTRIPNGFSRHDSRELEAGRTDGMSEKVRRASVATIPGSLRRIFVLRQQRHDRSFSRHDSRELEADGRGTSFPQGGLELQSPRFQGA